MRCRFGAAALLLAVAAASGAQSLPPELRQLNIQAFEQVWTTVRDKHWDPKINGVDWQAVHDELRPKVEAATTMGEARAAMEDMLRRLKQTHFGIVPGDAYKELDHRGMDAGASPEDGDPGIDLRIVDGHALVTFVAPDSPAASKGVKTGWEILRIGKDPVPPVLAKLHAASGHSSLAELTEVRAILARLEGPVNQTVEVEFLDGKDQKVTLQLPRTGPRGKQTVMGKLPPLHFWVESRKVAGDIGYVQFNMFFEPDAVEAAMRKAVGECGDCKGFVIDLRGNPGGIGGMAMGLGGWFTDQKGLILGTMYLRSATVKFAVFPRAEPFRGPLAILVDGCSASTSEIFAGGMQDLKRARIFGSHTAAAALPSMFDMLPNGDGFQYAIANYISQGGKPLEGIGVTPDREIKLNRRQLLNGQDAALDAAVSWIHTQKN